MSTEDLLKSVGEMSIHQYGAFSTIMLAKKIITSGYPKYIANRLETKNNNTRSGNIIPVEKTSLSLSREGFVFRSSILYNRLPENMKNQENLTKFKCDLKSWILRNIRIKP